MIDVAFNKFLTLKIIKVVWVISLILAALYLVGGLAYGFYGSVGEPTFDEAGNVTAEGARQPNWLLILLTPVAVAVWVLVTRIWLELVAVVFKIADNTAAMARGLPPAPPLYPVPDEEERSS